MTSAETPQGSTPTNALVVGWDDEAMTLDWTEEGVVAAPRTTTESTIEAIQGAQNLRHGLRV